MGFRLVLIVGLSVLLLCQCATKHQPIRFPATFQKFPEEVFSPGTVKECRLLEVKPSLSLLEKKRLMDLYTLEAKHVKAGTARFQELLEKSEQLRFEVEPIMTENENLKTELFLEKKDVNEEDKNVFETPGLKKAYSQVYQLWNKDENEQALTKAKELISNSEFKKSSTRLEWLKVLNLQFRIAHDIGGLAPITEAYQKLKEYESCAQETANAALLLSLTHFSKQEPQKALDIFLAQCDEDQSISNLTRRRYWQYRFRNAIDPRLAEGDFKELGSLPLPGFYLYLAKSQRGENFSIPEVDSQASRKYLDEGFEVAGSVSQYLLKAEERLKAGLKRDANLYLIKAVNSVKNNPQKNLFSMLYIAHLFRAAGNHLESMKTFSTIVGANKSPAPELTPVIHSEFLEMFPRPFSDKVSWLAKEWNIDEDFIYSIMRQESAFNPGAVSSTDARGLMQLMPSLARSLSHSWKYQPYSTDRVLFQAEENLKLSTYHLNQLQKLTPHLALIAAAYNAGFKRTTRWWQKFGNQPLDVFVEFIPVNETRNYVKLVLRNYLYYKAMRSGGSLPPNLLAMKLPEFSLPRTVSSFKKRQ